MSPRLYPLCSLLLWIALQLSNKLGKSSLSYWGPPQALSSLFILGQVYLAVPDGLELTLAILLPHLPSPVFIYHLSCIWNLFKNFMVSNSRHFKIRWKGCYPLKHWRVVLPPCVWACAWYRGRLWNVLSSLCSTSIGLWILQQKQASQRLLEQGKA